MDGNACCLVLLLSISVVIDAWTPSGKERRDGREGREGRERLEGREGREGRETREGREGRRDLHYHSKRHMLAVDNETRKGISTKIPRDIRKKAESACGHGRCNLVEPSAIQKPSGHLAPLEEDEIENDEVVSVAVGPPLIRSKFAKRRNPKFERKIGENSSAADIAKSVLSQLGVYNETTSSIATDLVKNVLSQLGKELLTMQVNEDFVFGQYVGNAMRNLTGDLKLKMQHEILDLVVKYQKVNRGDGARLDDKTMSKDFKAEKKTSTNETDDPWPEFTNLAGIVG